MTDLIDNVKNLTPEPNTSYDHDNVTDYDDLEPICDVSSKEALIGAEK